MIHLEGKKALVTGGSRGIGRATAILLAHAGADVAVNFHRRVDAAEEVKRRIQDIGRRCVLLRGDVSKKPDVERMIGDLVEEWNRIDILVNNAGIWTFGEIGNIEEEVWKQTIQVNLDAVYHTCNAVVPLMKEQRQGWIVNVSSTAGIRGEAYHSHYAATKGAVISFTKSLAAELGPFNIRVNCVAPGWVDTEMCEGVFQDGEFRKSVEESIPLKRIPPAEDIAGPIVFLVSDLARHITGEVLNVNGGAVLCA